MKTKHVKVISGIIALVFLVAILQLVLGVITDNTSAPLQSEERFNMLIRKISDAAGTYEPGTPEFSSRFIETVSAEPSLADISLELNGVQFYNYPTDYLEQSGSHLIQYTGNIRTVQGRMLNVKAVFISYKPYTVFHHARIAFLLILAGTIAAVILLMYLNLDRKYPDTKDTASIADEPEAEKAESGRAAAEEETEEGDAALPPDPAEEVPAEEAEAVLPLEPVEAETVEGEDILSLEVEEAGIPEEEKSLASDSDTKEIPEALPADSEEPAEILEAEEPAENFKDAIEAALQSAPDEDLSVFIFRTAPTAAQDEARELLEQKIGTVGYVTVYNGQLAAIIKNTGLDSALATAEALHRQLEPHTAVIGISSKAGRNIEARRLITEAEQAAAHADENAPVIAFRVDPEKYNKYLEENGRQA